MLDAMMNFLLPSAYAADGMGGPTAQGGGGFSFFAMLIIFVLFLYFGILRPQNKRAKEQQSLLNSLAKGDEVVTIGGILGKISKMTDQYLTLTLANNLDVIVQKSAVASVLPKGTIKALE